MLRWLWIPYGILLDDIQAQGRKARSGGKDWFTAFTGMNRRFKVAA